MAVLRRDAGPTQAQAARRIRYSRSAVARAEATGVCRRDLCSLAGQLYGAGNELAHEHDRIEALGAAARTLAAQQARQARHGDQPPAGIVAHAEETETAFTAVEAACPHCRKPVAVLLRHSTALLPVESPALPP